MKKLFIVLLFLLSMIISACCSKSPCPNQDVYLGFSTPFGIMPLQIPKGTFDDPDNYMTEEEIKELMEKTGQQPL